MGKTGARGYTGHNEMFRRMARGERVQFGLEHAPEKVDPPDNRCERCGNDTVLTVPSWFGRLCKGCEHEAAVEHWQSVLDLVEDEPSTSVMLGRTEIEMGEDRYHHPVLSVRHSAQFKSLAVTFYASGRAGKQKNYYPLRHELVGDQVEISTSGATKSLISLAEWQAFIDQVEVRVCDISQNTVELTPALVKMARDVEAYRRQAPTDAEWAAETSNIEMTPEDPPQESRCGICGYDGGLRELIGRTIDVFGETIDAEIKGKLDGKGVPRWWWARICSFEGKSQDLIRATGSNARICFPPFPGYRGEALDSRIEQYRYSMVLTNRGSELLPPRSTPKPTEPDAGREAAYVAMLNELSAADDIQVRLDQVMADMLMKFERWVALEYSKDTKCLRFMNIDYEKQAFGDTEQNFRKLFNREHRPPRPKKQHVIPGPEKFDRLIAGWRYSLALANRGSELIPERDPWVQPEITREYSFALDWLARIHRWIAAKQPAAAAPILPQDLQSKEEALEAIAMSKLLVQPSAIDDLVEAVQVAVEEWNNNADARILPDGYYLYGHPEGASIPTSIHLKHPSHPNRIIVGQMASEDWMRWASGKGNNDITLRFVSSRGEIREYMYKVAAGMKPSDNPMLPGIMVQAPIPDHVKMTPQLRTLKGMTEDAQTWFDIMNHDDGKDGTG